MQNEPNYCLSEDEKDKVSLSDDLEENKDADAMISQSSSNISKQRVSDISSLKNNI